MYIKGWKLKEIKETLDLLKNLTENDEAIKLANDSIEYIDDALIKNGKVKNNHSNICRVNQD